MVKKRQSQRIDKKQAIILVLVGFGIFSLFIVVAYIGQRNAESPTQAASGRRFTAKPGTTRENARALTSSRAPTESSSKPSSGTSGTQGTVSSWRDPKEAESVKESASEAEKLAEEAMEGLPTDEGIRKLEEALGLPQKREEATRLQVALAKLYSRIENIGVNKALAKYDEALANAPTQELRDYVVQESAQMLIQREEPDLAQARLSAALENPVPPSLPRLRLGVLLGKLHEKDGALEKAESVYKHTLEEGLALLKERDARVLGVVRFAGMRLSALYRSTDRDAEADAVAERVKVFLESAS